MAVKESREVVIEASPEEILDVVAPTRLVALLPIGRPAEVPPAQRRLPLDQVLSFR